MTVKKMKVASRKGSHFVYTMANGIISSLLFMIVYLIWLKSMNIMIQLPLLVVFSLVTGMFGSYFARKISGYKDYEINLQHYMASFLSSLLYAFLIWIGFITDILTWFDIQTGDGIVRLCIVFLILKIAVSYYCDEMADQITFKYKK